MSRTTPPAGRIGRSAALVAALALLAAPAAAGDQGRLRVLGFSPDGRYLAFEDSGEYDAMDGSWSKIHVVDAASDALAHAPFATDRPETDGKKPGSLEATRAENLAKAAPTLRSLGIRLDDPGAAPPLTFADKARSSARFELSGAAYEVRLSTRDIAAPDCFMETKTSVGYTLVLAGPRGRRTLHHDRRVPRSRGNHGCVLDYALAEVRAKGGRLVVFLEVHGPSTEGDSVDHIATAATIEPR
ncbi:MAG: DUF2259 domain-containing protein [Elusimicrobia bacterium]|nr:DUF2259 domain-containing protein [Elusimicrobiota bacterium]